MGKDTFSELADLADAMSPKITASRLISSTTYEITGELKSVLSMITAVFNDYHPAGYGTQVEYIKYLDGSYTAKIWRANSCE